MRVLYCHKVKDTRRQDCLASVDFEINPHIRLYGLRLLKKPDGAFYIYAPQANGSRRLATFSPELSARLTALAVESYEAANER
ncbi:hypothetical protein AB4Z34_07415 [Ensifer sp. 2YAB10]|uniref:hypothetical protein n=1 Tax=Ensifer TaxID=106591 RepID=UPI0015692F51|nr:hypothetical protein [Ensifer sesbaniae]NRQ15575.1 hypothetical protein [Ensifer sesbaniae]